MWLCSCVVVWGEDTVHHFCVLIMIRGAGVGWGVGGGGWSGGLGALDGGPDIACRF